MPKFRYGRKWYDAIVDDLSLKYKKDPRVVKHIIDYPFLFLKRRMEDAESKTPVRLRHLGAWTLKRDDLKELAYQNKFNRAKKYMSKFVEKGIFSSEKEGLEKINSLSVKEFIDFYPVLKKLM